MLRMPSLGGLSVAKPLLDLLPLTPRLQKEHPHSPVQLLMLRRAGEIALGYRRGRKNYLSAGLGSCALIRLRVSFVSQDPAPYRSHSKLIQLLICLGTNSSRSDLIL